MCIAPLLFPNMWYFLRIIKAYKWLFARLLFFCCRRCRTMEVEWRMSLPLCFIKRVTFFFSLCHPTPISFQYIWWIPKSNEHIVFLYSHVLYKREKLKFQSSLKFWVDAPPQNNQSINKTYTGIFLIYFVIIFI